MGTGVMVGDLMAVADVGELWGEAEKRRKGKAQKKKKSRRADGAGVDGSEVDGSDAAVKFVRQQCAQWGSTAQRITAKRLGGWRRRRFWLIIRRFMSSADGMGPRNICRICAGDLARHRPMRRQPARHWGIRNRC